MKKLIIAALSASMLVSGIILPAGAAEEKATETISYTYTAGEGVTYEREMEKLNRGLVAVDTGNGVYLSWRLFDSEDAIFGSAEQNVSFEIYRDGDYVDTVDNSTNFFDADGSSENKYSLRYTNNSVRSIENDSVTVSVTDKDYKVYAAKYDGSALSKLALITPSKAGTDTYNIGFKADRVFIWDDKKPVENAADSTSISVQGTYDSARNAYYFDIPIDKPDDATLADGSTAPYTANDASCADLDGDGEYEIVLKWIASGHDNETSGYTGNVLIDAYKLNGTKLWRIDLGPNIRAGAHYTQFLVYDFDGDGKAEMMCQTAPGSRDGTGTAYVSSASHVDTIKSMTDSDNEKTFRNSSGYMYTYSVRANHYISNDEFLTVFDGLSGRAIDTIYYPNQVISPTLWGDDYGNRCDRFTATVAYMDGVKPYGVYMRGYYMRQSSGSSERQAACAVSFDGSELDCKYSFDTYDADSYAYKLNSPSYIGTAYKGVNGYVEGNEIFVGEGNHNCATADVDNDGKDEVMTGALCYEINDDDRLAVKWCTFLEHGDALHIGDYDPTHPGFEFFTVQEDGGPNTKGGSSLNINYGMTVIDPAINSINTTDTETYNKLVMFHEGSGRDTGRGMMANTGMGGYYQFWSSINSSMYKSYGGTDFVAGTKPSSMNFRIFWDGDLYDELLDGSRSWNKTELETDTYAFDAAITSWDGEKMKNIFTTDGCRLSNNTKANPALQADLFGDWREELVMRLADSSALRVYGTTIPTDFKIKTLMHDPVYRSGVSAEQTAYNQPPHVGMYLSPELFGAPVKSVSIHSLPAKTTYIVGEKFESSGLELEVVREDGKTEIISDYYSISGFDAETPGTKTVTVSYGGKSVTFDIEYRSPDIALINGVYTTSGNSSASIPIGTYTGDFTISHKMTINQMPADGTTSSPEATGFFLRFTPKSGMGAGWYLTANGTGANAIWKAANTNTIARALSLNTEYTFVYDFKNIGGSSGVSVDLTIYKPDGTIFGNAASGLSLRNMDSNKQPLTKIDIFNHAKSGQEASITISDATLTQN